MPSAQVLQTVIVAITLGFMAAAATPAAAGATANANDRSALSGRWTVKALQKKEIHSPAGDITFDTTDGSISGATACNLFRGTFEAPAGALSIKVGMMTRRACISDAADHERAFLEAMSNTATFRIDSDRLILTATDGTALAELIRTPDAALEGRQHKIVSYLKDGGLYSIRAETEAVITLKEGRIEGSTGCRPFTANYTLSGDALSITGVTPAQTLAPCADNVRDQDEGILANLPLATTFDTSRNLIRLLKKADGSAVLWITPETP